MQLPDIIATMVGLYLEDSLPENIVKNMEEYKTQYTQTQLVSNIESAYNNIFSSRIVELNALKENKEKELDTACARTIINNKIKKNNIMSTNITVILPIHELQDSLKDYLT